jgi:hypothetical protein
MRGLDDGNILQPAQLGENFEGENPMSAVSMKQGSPGIKGSKPSGG